MTHTAPWLTKNGLALPRLILTTLPALPRGYARTPAGKLRYRWCHTAQRNLPYTSLFCGTFGRWYTPPCFTGSYRCVNLSNITVPSGCHVRYYYWVRPATLELTFCLAIVRHNVFTVVFWWYWCWCGCESLHMPLRWGVRYRVPHAVPCVLVQCERITPCCWYRYLLHLLTLHRFVATMRLTCGTVLRHLPPRSCYLRCGCCCTALCLRFSVYGRCGSPRAFSALRCLER